MRQINDIIVHCSDTPADMDIGADEIDRWHRKRGWLAIGYHFVIRSDGTVETGRPLATAGAHVKGMNANSIGICLVGGKGVFNFTKRQLDALHEMYGHLSTEYPNAKWSGHRDLDSAKECPRFDVKSFFEIAT